MTEPHDGKSAGAYHALRSAILRGELEQAASLRVKELSQRFGYGWTPLREALSRLEAEALVISERNRGFFVAPATLSDLEDLQRTRFVIERPLLEEAIAVGNEAWEDAVVAAHFRLSKCVLPFEAPSEESAAEWERRHVAFHNALLSAAQSPWLRRLQEQIYAHLMRHHRALGVVSAVRQEYTLAQLEALRRAMGIDHHTRLMTAAINRDADEAVALLEEHGRFTLDVFKTQSGAKQRPTAVEERERDAPDDAGARRGGRHAPSAHRGLRTK
jgi:DNA-binding GntR family transcriptional regulator